MPLISQLPLAITVTDEDIILVVSQGVTSRATRAAFLADAVSRLLPVQTGNAGKFLTTDGTSAAWQTISVPVQSVFGRTGLVAAQTGDYAVNQITGAAPLSSPAFTGTPVAPTASPSTNSTQIATCAFVQTSLPAVPVQSVFGRTGIVVAATGDYTVAQVTNATSVVVANTFSVGPNLFQTGGAGNVGVVVKGAPSQTANLQEWQDSSGTAKAFVTANGAINIRSSVATLVNVIEAYDSVANTTQLVIGRSGGSNLVLSYYVPTLSTLFSSAVGAGNVTFRASDYAFQFSAAANIGTTINANGGWTINSLTVGTKPLVLKGTASQTANLQEWQQSDATVHATVSENGYFTTRKNVAPADAELQANEAAYWFDSTNGAARFVIKAKTANGTVVGNSINLA